VPSNFAILWEIIASIERGLAVRFSSAALEFG
jgi:hypothetical protein